jgi:hypothetical protein
VTDRLAAGISGATVICDGLVLEPDRKAGAVTHLVATPAGH